MIATLDASLSQASQIVLDEFRPRGFTTYSRLDLQKFGPDTVVYRFLYTAHSDHEVRALFSLQETIRCSVIIRSRGRSSSIEIKKSERPDEKASSSKGRIKLRARVDELLGEIFENIKKSHFPSADAA